MIKISALLAEVKRIQADMPDVDYFDRLDDLMSKGDEGGGEYGECVYVLNLEPACIVGLALHNLGITIDRLYDYEAHRNTNIADIAQSFTNDFDIDSNAALSELNKIQENQDLGISWGSC